MATCIEAVATSGGRRGLPAHRTRRLADEAARLCLASAGRQAGEVDLLINAGIYHDRNIGEPAVAALIQEDIGANPGHPPVAGHGTFSFDLYNGACGVLTAVSLLDGFLASGTIGLGMVVASDAAADHGGAGARFPAVGGAVLLSRTDARRGFSAFRIDTYPEFADRFHSEVHWVSRRLPGRARSAGGLATRRGRNVLTIEEADDYLLRTLECTERSVKELVADAGMGIADLDAVVGAGPAPGFCAAVAGRLGISPPPVLPADRLAGAHTAGMLVALDAAVRSGLLSGTGTVLLVSAGSGITVSAALYRL